MATLADLIPLAVKDAVGKHFETHERAADKAYWRGMEEEDALGSDYWSTFCTAPLDVLEPSTGEKWRVEFSYHKLQGRGPKATEKLIGADGVIHLFVETPEGTFVKGLLFQAKKDWTYDAKVSGQAADMVALEAASVVVNHTVAGLEVYDIRDVAKAGGAKTKAGEPQDLNWLMREQLLECSIGAENLYYDQDRRQLEWPTSQGYTATSFAPKNHVAISVRAPELLQEVMPELERDLRLPKVERRVSKKTWDERRKLVPKLNGSTYEDATERVWDSRFSHKTTKVSPPTVSVGVKKK